MQFRVAGLEHVDHLFPINKQSGLFDLFESLSHQESQVHLLCLVLPYNSALLSEGCTDRNLFCRHGILCIARIFISCHVLLALLEAIGHVADGILRDQAMDTFTRVLRHKFRETQIWLSDINARLPSEPCKLFLISLF